MKKILILATCIGADSAAAWMIIRNRHRHMADAYVEM